jgi:hypothetical protein
MRMDAQTDGQTDRRTDVKLIGTFHDYAKPPNRKRRAQDLIQFVTSYIVKRAYVEAERKQVKTASFCKACPARGFSQR